MNRTTISLRALCLVATISIGLIGCGRAPDDPVREITALIDMAESAAEGHDAQTIVGMLSDDYEDEEGHDRRTMAFLVRSWLGRYPNLLLVVSDLAIEPVSAELATAQLALTAVGRDGTRPVVSGIDADRIRVRLALSRESGQWRVSRAEWSR